MASWVQVARDWAKGGIDNPKFAKLVKQRRDELFTASLTAGGLDKMTSATKNGVSMGMEVGLSGPETLAALTRACEWIEAGFIPSQSTGYGRF